MELQPRCSNKARSLASDPIALQVQFGFGFLMG